MDGPPLCRVHRRTNSGQGWHGDRTGRRGGAWMVTDVKGNTPKCHIQNERRPEEGTCLGRLQRQSSKHGNAWLDDVDRLDGLVADDGASRRRGATGRFAHPLENGECPEKMSQSQNPNLPEYCLACPFITNMSKE